LHIVAAGMPVQQVVPQELTINTQEQEQMTKAQCQG